MNRDELESMLADHLAGELPAEKEAVFQEAMACDPALAAEAESLKRTLRAFDALGAAPGRPQRRISGAALLRYAAVVALAFAGGWLLRGAQATSPAPSDAGPPDTDELEVRFAQVYMEQPAGSDLARSLVALARTTQ